MLGVSTTRDVAFKHKHFQHCYADQLQTCDVLGKCCNSADSQTSAFGPGCHSMSKFMVGRGEFISVEFCASLCCLNLKHGSELKGLSSTEVCLK
jgi:hypothetical protein